MREQLHIARLEEFGVIPAGAAPTNQWLDHAWNRALEPGMGGSFAREMPI
jgi:hypothetical protein